MSRDEQLKQRWDLLVKKLTGQFGDGEELDLDAIIYLVGVQEVGTWTKRLKKDEKIQVMHVAICRLLEPFGYYRFQNVDQDGWPHYENLEPLPPLKAGEQALLMKEALVLYFLENEYID